MDINKKLFILYNWFPPIIKQILKLIYNTFLKDIALKRTTSRFKKDLIEITMNYHVKENEVFIELKNGLKFLIPIDKPLNNSLFSKVSYEYLIEMCPLVTELRELAVDSFHEEYYKLKKGDVVVDAGANVGIFTINAAKSVGPEGKVIAIEPEKKNMMLLKRNAKLNNCHNIIFIQKALSDNKGNSTLTLGESATNTLFPENLGDSVIKNTESVKTDTLQNIISNLDLHCVNFIKMDIEGAEIVAIKGGLSLIKRTKPVLSMAAYHHVDGKTTYKELVPLLESIGYNIIKESLPHIYAIPK